MKNKIKVLFVAPILGGGGVERVVSNLLSHLDKKRFDTSLVLYRKEGAYLDTRLQHVPTFRLHSKGEGLLALPKEIWATANIIRREKPGVVFSLLARANLIAVLAARLSGVKTSVVISERGNLTMVLNAGSKIRSLLLRWGVKMLYRYADCIVTVSDGVKDDLIKNFGILTSKIKTIYNPVDIERISRLAREPVDHPWFDDELPVVIAMGRLESQKGYPYLLRAIARVKNIHPCRLMILGEGKKRGEQEYLVQELGIKQNVAFLGFQKNPFKYLARADFFVLPSLWEGFGNVIIEAMACGAPVIASHCPSGPDEIIKNGFNGLLVPPADDGALADAMLSVLDDKELARRLSENGRCRAKDFSANKGVRKYGEIFERMSRVSR